LIGRTEKNQEKRQSRLVDLQAENLKRDPRIPRRGEVFEAAIIDFRLLNDAISTAEVAYSEKIRWKDENDW
jgi:hypothetical protein